MHVVATAGHVDHGKSTLVRALTGVEPDRWAEERRRGMTIDLGFASMTLPSGEVLGFVDVPGHQRFISNMLAGVGPAPAVMMVVAADEGWRRQSAEHLAAIDALGLQHGLLVVTRSDLADPAPAIADARERIAATSLGTVEAVSVSGTTGEGLPQLREALDRLVARLPQPDTTSRIRLWVDRAFTIRGSGTVVTGTLGAGTIRVGDELALGSRLVRVRGLQSLGEGRESVAAVARVAANLRAVEKDDVHRGDALVTPGAWPLVRELDARLTTAEDLPRDLVLHVGSAAVPARLRPLDGDLARISLAEPLPLEAGDRALLRDPGRQSVASGVLVLDVDPPALTRRGAARQRAAELATAGGTPDIAAEVRRRGAVRTADLVALGVEVPATDDPEGIRRVGDWLLDPERWQAWVSGLAAHVDSYAARNPLEPGMPVGVARSALALPDVALLRPIVAAAGLESQEGRIRRPGAVPTLGAAAEAVSALEERLRAEPFAAPERPELDALGLGTRHLAAAATAGRLLRLADDVVLLPDGPARAMRVLASLPQPFTLSEARQALGTTRRVAVPLLEHLDGRGWTRRVDGSHREVVR